MAAWPASLGGRAAPRRNGGCCLSTPLAARRGAPAAGRTDAADADSLRSQWRRRWQTLAPRERSAVRAVLWLLGSLAVWLFAVQPAWRTLREAPLQLTQAEGQLQQMRRLADEAKGLRGVAPVPPSQAAAALRAATERLGNGARLTVQGERVTLTLPAAGSPTAGAGSGSGNPGGGFGGPAGIPPGIPSGNGSGAGGPPLLSGGTAGGVSGDALRGWLSEARSAARARPVDLQLTRGGSGFSGSVVVLIGPGGSTTGSAP